MPQGADPSVAIPLARISDPGVDAVIAGDVLPDRPGSPWRWTNQHPRVKLSLDSVDNQEFYARFTVAGAVLKEVGPVTVHMIVNDREIGVKRFDREGLVEYRHPVPASLLGDGNSVIAGLDIDPVLVSKRDGVKLGVLLEAIGFERARR